MNASKRKKLEATGWSAGSTADFLELTEPEATLVEMRIALASALRIRRVESRLTQAELAKRIGSRANPASAKWRRQSPQCHSNFS